MDAKPYTSNPFRLLASPLPWVSVAYLGSYLVVGTLFFAFTLALVLVAGVLSIIWIGLPLLLAAAVVMSGFAQVELGRAYLLSVGSPYSHRTTPDIAAEPIADPPGFMQQLKARWTDPVTARRLVYLVVLWPLLLIIDVIGLAWWIATLGMVALPFWYWSIPQEFDGRNYHGVSLGYFPHGPDGEGGIGVWVGDLPTALLVAGAGLVVLVFISNYLIVGIAKMHAGIANHMLSADNDPLAEAKDVLNQPGPLTHKQVPGI